MFYELWKPGPAGQWIVAITACISALTCGQGFSWSAPAVPKIRSGNAGFSLTDDEEAWMITATFLGNVASPIPAGYISDYIGRKNTLLVFDIMAIISWVLIFFSYSALGLYIARFLIGLWGGFVYTVVPIFIGEVVTPEIRGSVGAIFAVSLYLGGAYESFLGMFCSYQTLALLSSIPAILLFIALLFLPESPYFSLMKGKVLTAAKSLEWLRGSCDSDHLDKMESFVKEQLENEGTFLDIFKTKATRKAFFLVQALGILQRASGLSLLVSYISIILPTSWFSEDQNFLILSFFWIIGSISSSFIMNRFDRRTLLIISGSGSSISMALVATWFYLRDFTNFDTLSTEGLPLFFLILNGLFYSFGFVSIPTLIQGEMFPVNIKSKASALSSIIASLISSISVRLYQPITKYVGVYFNFVICCISSALGVLFAFTIMIETRGRSLEEIQEILTERRKQNPKEQQE